MELEVVRTDPVWLEETKHERTCLKALGGKAGIPREHPNKDIVDADYKEKRIFCRRLLVGEYKEGCTGGGGFVVNGGATDKEVSKMDKRFTGKEVGEELWRSISE